MLVLVLPAGVKIGPPRPLDEFLNASEGLTSGDDDALGDPLAMSLADGASLAHEKVKRGGDKMRLGD